MAHKIVTQNTFDDSLTQYGDGVFETMLGVGNAIHHWDYHWQRLENSCRRLAISVPERDLLTQQLAAKLAELGHEFSVVKMIVSRGAGLRGYRSHEKQPCYVQFRISPHSLNTASYQGLNLRICQTRLSHQPLLAGMKHINRLEYVMARREAEEAQFDEGLLLNYDNDLIEGLISNVFIIKNQQIFTPDLSGCGVAGTFRAYLLAQLSAWGYMAEVRCLDLAAVADADEIFLTNATGGVMPVATVAGIDKRFSCVAANLLRQRVEHPCSAV